MRKRVLWNVPHVRISLVMLLTLMISLAVAGCGGGGGSSPNPNPGGTSGVPVGDPKLATVTGIVTDTTAAAGPVSGAVVGIAGTTLKATTGADGKFAITNVPVGTGIGVTVLTPNAQLYYGLGVLYGAPGAQKQYDTSRCPISITTQASSKGTSPIPYPLELYPAGAGSPPPPPPTIDQATGCPK